ncbi:hypothetical protein FHG87_007050 [Trinorchestia longiramus]|nr:hypothetical protein FHG87_007050 [Trinorchestia longiramus]
MRSDCWSRPSMSCSRRSSAVSWGMENGSEKLIYVLVGNQVKVVTLPAGASSDYVKDSLRRVANAGQCDVIKLHRSDGLLINPSSDLMPNSPSDPYKLHLAATSVEDSLRRVANAGQCDVIKLHRSDGLLINPSSDLMPNSPSDPYKLHLAATSVEGKNTSTLLSLSLFPSFMVRHLLLY